MNPLYNQFNGNNQPSIDQLAEQVKQLQRAFSGDPRQVVQQMLNSGRLSQSQFNLCARTATQIAQKLNIH